MPRTFFTYTLTVLEKVSFHPQLFKKELEKAYQSLLPNERLELQLWLKNFLIKHPALAKELKEIIKTSGKKPLQKF